MLNRFTRAFKTIFNSTYWYLSLLILLPICIVSINHAIELQQEVQAERMMQPKQQIQTVYNILEYFHKLEQNKTLSREMAQFQAKMLISRLRYNENDYFWINDQHGVLIMHPFKPEYEGYSLLGFKDKNGVRLFAEMIHITNEHGEGYVTYYWPKPNSSMEVSKISYVRSFKQWGWIIGSGVYSIDIEEKINMIIRNNIILGIIIFLVSILLISNILHQIEVKYLKLRRENND